MKKKNNQGFTLVEMLIVVAIIAILVAIAIPVYRAHLERVEEQVCYANRQMLVRLYYVDYQLNNDEVDMTELIGEHDEIACPAAGGNYYADEDGIGVLCKKHVGDVVDPGGGNSLELEIAEGITIVARMTIENLIETLNGNNLMPSDCTLYESDGSFYYIWKNYMPINSDTPINTYAIKLNTEKCTPVNQGTGTGSFIQGDMVLYNGKVYVMKNAGPASFNVTATDIWREVPIKN